METEKYNSYEYGIRMGEIWENALEKYASSLGFGIKRNDKERRGDADFELRIKLELKHHATPLFKAQKLVNLDPAKTITIDVHKLEKYSAQNASVLIYLDYRPAFKTFGVFLISGRRLKILLDANPKRVLNLEKRRNVAHQSKQTFHFLTSECLKFPDFVFHGIRRFAEKN